MSTYVDELADTLERLERELEETPRWRVLRRRQILDSIENALIQLTGATKQSFSER